MSTANRIIALGTVLAALATAGCGGSGGGPAGQGGFSAAAGIWTGGSVQTRAAGDTGAIRGEFRGSAGSLTGAVVITTPTSAVIAAVTGTISAGHVTATGIDTAGEQFGLGGNIVGTTFTGTYTIFSQDTNQAGTFTMAKAAGASTPDLSKVALGWSGEYVPNGGALQYLSLGFTQSGNDIEVDGTTGQGGFGVAGTHFHGNGAVIGTSVTIIFPGSGKPTLFFGTYNGAIVSGTTLDGQGKTGTFSVGPPT